VDYTTLISSVFEDGLRRMVIFSFILTKVGVSHFDIGTVSCLPLWCKTSEVFDSVQIFIPSGDRLLVRILLFTVHFGVKISGYLPLCMNALESCILAKELCISNDRFKTVILVALRSTFVTHVLAIF
jgi:hypothetical protein